MVSFGVNCGERHQLPSPQRKSEARGIPRTFAFLPSSTSSDTTYSVLTDSFFSPTIPTIPLPPEFAEMDSLLATTAENWEQPHSIDEQEEEPVEEPERPRKKRRKYIARAWCVF